MAIQILNLRKQRYKYFYILSLFLIFIPSFLRANDSSPLIPDSLQLKVQQAQSDTARFNAMINVALWMNNYRSDLLLDYLKDYMEQVQRTENSFWIARGHNVRGIYYSHIPDYDNALKDFFEAIRRFEALNEKKWVAAAAHNVAGIYEQMKNNAQALFYFQKAIKINSEISNKAWLLRNYNGISVIYKNLGKKDSALLYLQKSLELAENLKAKRGIMFANGNLGVFYSDDSIWHKAESYYKVAHLLAKELKDDKMQGQYAANLAFVYVGTNHLAEAENLLNEALSIFQKHKYKKHYEFCYLTYSHLEKKKGNFEQALKYYQKYHQISDSLLSEEKNKATQEYDIKYQSEKKEKEISILRKDNTIKDLQIYGLSFIAILLVVFIAYFYYTNKEIKNKNTLITQANEKLNSLLQEKDNIIATVSHDYRSPLGRIRAVVDLVLLQKENLTEKQQKHLQKIPIILSEATHLIDDLLDVSHIEKLKEQLLPEKIAIKSILTDIIEGYQDWIKQKNLQISLDFPTEDCILNADKQAFRRIFDNLISNAIKYSYLDKNIFLKIQKDENRYKIWIKDEGQGFSTEDKNRIFTRFQRLSAQPIGVGNSYGLGLSIVKTLIDGLGAEIELEDTAIGASFCISFENAN